MLREFDCELCGLIEWESPSEPDVGQVGWTTKNWDGSMRTIGTAQEQRTLADG